MNTTLLLIIFGLSLVGLLKYGTVVYRMHNIGPQVFQSLHFPKMSSEDFSYYFIFHWVFTVICAVGVAVSALVYIKCFVSVM